MNSNTYRYLSAGVLAVWATVLCFFYFTGRVKAYLHPSFHLLVLLCGAGLFLLAILIAMAPSGVKVGCATPSYSSLGGVVGGAVLVIPLIIALIFSKDAFGATAVQNRAYVEDISQLSGGFAPSISGVTSASPILPGEDSSSQTEEEEVYDIPKNSEGDIVADIVDLLYAAEVPEMRKIFEEQPVEVVGQVVPAKNNNAKGNRYDIVRLFMTCCAADARPVVVTAEPISPPGLEDMSWVKVRAKATFPLVGGKRRPFLEGAKIIPIDPTE
ncbi:MAG: hypothetical protein ACK5LK_01690 [Chthoniobacterales bacterium]